MRFYYKFIIIGCIFLSLTIIPNSVATNNQQNSNNLLINSNNDLLNDASTNGWSGNGSESNPIIISNLQMNNCGGYYAIQISNTNLWLSLNNITISDCEAGIWLNNTQNVFIQNINLNIINNYFSIEPLSIKSSNNINMSYIKAVGYIGGLFVQNSTTVSIKDSIIQANVNEQNTNVGLTVVDSNVISFINNSFSLTNSIWNLSVDMISSNDIDLIQNNFDSYSGWNIQNSNSVSVTNNRILSDGINIDGCLNFVAKNNTIAGKSIYFYQFNFQYPIKTQYYNFNLSNNTINGLQILYLFNTSNYTVKNKDLAEVLVVLSNNISIANCNFQSVDLIRSNQVTLSQSSFVEGDIIQSDNATLLGNDIYGKTYYQSSNSLKISKNTFYYNKNYINGINNIPLYRTNGPNSPTSLVCSNKTTIESNIFYSNIDINYPTDLNITGNLFNNSVDVVDNNFIDFNAIIIHNGKSIFIKDNSLGTKLDNGIQLIDSLNITVLFNNITNNYGTGLALYNVTNALIQENQILKNSEGVSITNSHDIYLIQNDVSEQKSKSMVIGNTHYDFASGIGINIVNSTSINLQDNKIRFNSKTGFHIQSSIGVTVKNNIVEWNGDFVRLIITIVDIILVSIIIAGLLFIYYLKKRRSNIERKI